MHAIETKHKDYDMCHLSMKRYTYDGLQKYLNSLTLISTNFNLPYFYQKLVSII